MANKNEKIILNFSKQLNECELKVFNFMCFCYYTDYYDEKENKINIFLKPEITKDKSKYINLRHILKEISDAHIIIREGKYEIRTRFINKIIIEQEKNLIICQMSDFYKEYMSSINLQD